MSETFLTHTNRVIARLNEVQLTSSDFANSRGIQTQCKNAVNEAVRYINQKEFQYPFNHSTKTQKTQKNPKTQKNTKKPQNPKNTKKTTTQRSYHPSVILVLFCVHLQN